LVTKYNLVKSKSFIEKAGKGIIEPSDLENIFVKTAQLLSKEPHKANCLLYPGAPREHEAKQAMSTVLTELGYHHMVERPVKNPIPDKTPGNGPLMIDLSMYTNGGIIDVEFKGKLDDIGRDFPKLFASSAIGCAIFYIFREKSIDNALNRFIIKKYQLVYDEMRRFMKQRQKIRDKWFRFFVCAYKEKRVFTKHYNSINNIDFSEVEKNEIM
jgi:hypothetical protein